MKKGELIKKLNKHFTDEAEILIGETHQSLAVIEDDMCALIKLDGEWEYKIKKE